MKIKLRDFSTFLNEEADIKKNIGLPDDFTRNAEEDVKRNLGVNVDSGEEGRLSEYMNKAASIIVRSIPIEQVENKFQQMENLAKRVIEEEFKTIFQILPLDLKLRLIRPNESVIGQLPELGEKQEEPGSRPEINEEPEEIDEVQPEGESDETQSNEEQDDFFDFFDFDSDEEQQESEEENIEEITEPEVTNKDVAMAIDKTQILNMITQGAGKATKDIIKFSETISKGLEDIIGSNAKELLKVWGQLSDEADKRDWRVPMDITKNLFKNSPGGLAGAVKVDFFENYNLKFKNSELIIESGNASKIIIRAFGVDFPMLLHEAVKGIYMALQSPAIKKNPELAEEIKRATSSYKDETSDFRYGPLAQKMFRDFVNHCNMADRYPNMIERVFFFLSKDVEHGGKFTDEEFLKITKSMFSVFDKVNTEAGKFQFRINEENFQSSEAKTKIEEIIKEEVQFEEELEAEERAEDLKKALPSENEPIKSSEPAGEDEEDEIEKLRRATAERESDYTNMSPREIQELIDDALDSGDYERVKMLSGYLTKESAQIYLRELERINENKIIRR
jgi:hypothetical protein